MKIETISIDFDMTITGQSEEGFPKIGKLKRNAKRYINILYNEGHYIIINSCRHDQPEQEMKTLLDKNGIKYHKINENLDHKIDQWGDCRKIGADLYIDDKNIGSRIIIWEDIYNKIKEIENHKPIIFCLLGASGSGKTTAAKYIESEHSIPMILSYTTRPKRYENEIGHTFITNEQFYSIPKENMTAYTKYGDYEYCATKDQVKDICSYVIDIDGLRMLQDNPNYRIISILLITQHNYNISPQRKARDKEIKGNFDYIINNNGSKENLYKQLDQILKKEIL